MSENEGLFKKLTRLFRNGPVVKRKVKQYQGKNSLSKSSLEVFRKAHSDVYNSTLSAYGSYDRMARYSDFSEMESTPEISSALDIYAEECVSPDAEGNVLHIYSDNKMIRELLSELFYDVLNVDFNMVMWVRNLCKYGDFFLFNDVHPEYGIINVFPIPIAEIEREEGFDPKDPSAVRFRWITQGNRVLENWQISHFRMLGNDAFLPYGSSVLEGARRIWRQLILIEDAMLVYRVIRSPERRVFYIDVGNIPPENVANYLEQAQTSLKRNAVVDKSTGQVDLRYNPLSVDEDYFLPVRGGDTGTRIDTLAGGSNTTAIEDVEYIQKKLFAALKIPKAYLGYDEDIGAKATLAQEDIRFSRTIQRIQKTIIAELTKVAIIHLYTHGYSDEDLLDFELKLSNPSSIAQQQKLELVRTKFEIAGQAPEGYFDREWIRKHILDLTNDEIERIQAGRVSDRLEDMELESVQLETEEMPDEGGDDSGGLDMPQGEEQEMPAGPEQMLGGGGDEPPGEGLAGLFAHDDKQGKLVEKEIDEDEIISEIDYEGIKEKSSKVKPSKKVRDRKVTKKYRKNPVNMMGNKISNKANTNPDLSQDRDVSGMKKMRGEMKLSTLADSNFIDSPVIGSFVTKQVNHKLAKSLDDMSAKLNISTNKPGLLRENVDVDDILIDDKLFEEEN